jgi:hypothetical protein
MFECQVNLQYSSHGLKHISLRYHNFNQYKY